MRIFGYNVQNGFYKSDITMEQNSSELIYLRNQSIIRRYQSKVRGKYLFIASKSKLT